MDILHFLQKGALLAQNTVDMNKIEELNEDDREVIRREKTRMSFLSPCKDIDKGQTELYVVDKWNQPRTLYFTVVLCSLAAAVRCVCSIYSVVSLNIYLEFYLLGVGIKLVQTVQTCRFRRNLSF